MIKTKPLYFLIFPIILIFLYFYPGKVPSIFFYIPFFLVITSFIYGGILYLSFKYTQSVDKKSVIKGEKVKFKFSVHNEFFFLYPFIKIGFYGEDYVFNRQTKNNIFGLSPFTHKSVDYEWECKYRGDYSIGIEYVEIKDLLGLFSFYYYINEPKKIQVYPRINHLSHFRMNTSYISESDTVIRSDIEDMTSISDIRKYAYGDSLRKVHWKLTAKRNEWMVKNFDNTAQMFVVMLLDLKRNLYKKEENLLVEDQIIECIVAVTHYCLKSWVPVELVYYKEGYHTIKGRNALDFNEFYDFMHEVKFNQDIDFSNMMKMYLAKSMQKNNIILFTSNLGFDLYDRIYEARVGGYDVMLIYVSPEEIIKEKNENEDKILQGLKEVGVNVYVVQISDNIKQVLGC